MNYYHNETAVLTSKAALRAPRQVRGGAIQQGVQVLGSLGDTFGVPVSGAKHLHCLPHRVVHLTHGCKGRTNTVHSENGRVCIIIDRK